jgi:hypothetical protein
MCASILCLIPNYRLFLAHPKNLFKQQSVFISSAELDIVTMFQCFNVSMFQCFNVTISCCTDINLIEFFEIISKNSTIELFQELNISSFVSVTEMTLILNSIKSRKNKLKNVSRRLRRMSKQGSRKCEKFSWCLLLHRKTRYLISHILYLVSYILYLISCILYLVSYILYQCFRYSSK